MGAGLAIAIIALVACSSSGSTSEAPTTPSRSSASVVTFAVTSSIADGATLSKPVAWTATVSGGAAKQVDFAVDGKVRWTEMNAPFFFDDGNFLHPWLLGAGEHRLMITATGASGRTASTTSTITVTPVAPVPAPLVGTWARTMTQADLVRTAGNPPPADAPPPGRWVLHIKASGLIDFDDPDGGGATESFRAEVGGSLQLTGNADWATTPDRRGGFCESEPAATYRWKSTGSGTLVVTGSDKTCSYRNAMFQGTWVKETS